MPEGTPQLSKRLLNPTERISEILFGLIMVLTITCSFSIGSGGHTEVRQMLTGALGCNLAWGIIDATMYLMARLSERGQAILALRAVRCADSGEGQRLIAQSMPPLLASVTAPPTFEVMRQGLMQLPEPPQRPRLAKNDWLAAFGVFLLVLGATLPVALPFIFVPDARQALRLSNAIAIGMLFLAGYIFGEHAGHHPWKMGFAMVLIGGAMVGMTIALGG